MYKTDFKSSGLWRRAFEGGSSAGAEAEAMLRLSTAYDRFRERASILASEISRDLPFLTDHSVHHLDALWVLASEIAGEDCVLTPLEAFVLGGSILLHDLANSLVAFPGRLDDLRGREWDDQLVSVYLRTKGRRPTTDEMKDPPEDVRNQVVFARLREVHASAAVRLATVGFVRADDGNERHYLIEDEELRDSYGELIGKIANSHHWSIQRVEEEFAGYRVSGAAWFGWQVDALKVACLLRCADASHLDMHRASTLLMSLRAPTGESAKHWTFQNRLHPAALNPDTAELEFRSTRPFRRQDREAWWLAFDMVNRWVDGEIKSANRVLRRNGRQPLEATGAAGVDNPEAFRRLVETSGWEPVDIAVRITDVATVIERFGGQQLYGSSNRAPLRELVANGADAVRARRNVPYTDIEATQGAVIVRIEQATDGAFALEVEDNGIGMSDSVLRGPLLDFGSSFWSSSLAASEFPGLLASAFRPTGKFGIGFFSVFMLGGSIKVTTRRHDAGRLDTHVLELTRGFRYPMLRRPDANARDEVLPRGGTRVRVVLDESPWTRRGVVGEVQVPEAATDGEVKRRRLSALKSLVSRLAPAVDVDVWVEVDGDREIAVHAADWAGLEFDGLLDRIGDKPRFRPARKLTDYVCEPTRGDRLLGRFRLVGDDANRGARTTLAVGGFAAGWSQNYVEGMVLGDSPVLSRREGEVVLTEEEFDEQVKLAVKRGFLPDHDTSPGLATFLLSRGVAPVGLRCFITADGALTIDGLRSLAAGLIAGQEIFIVQDDSFEFESEFGSSESVSLTDVWARLEGSDAVIVVARGKSMPSWGWDWMSGAPAVWNEDSPPPKTLLQLAVLVVAASWGLPWQELEMSQDEQVVGSIQLRGGDDYEISLETLRIIRPNQEEDDEFEHS